MKVTLDVFSGRPNPSWELPDHDADSVVERFAARATPAALAAPPRLGYRGYVVDARSIPRCGGQACPRRSAYRRARISPMTQRSGF